MVSREDGKERAGSMRCRLPSTKRFDETSR
jgi:hypothetical protein